MLAHLCWYRPGGEFDCERNAELTPLPKGSAATYRTPLPEGVAVWMGWRAVVNGMTPCKVLSVAGGAVELVRVKGNDAGV